MYNRRVRVSAAALGAVRLVEAGLQSYCQSERFPAVFPANGQDDQDRRMRTTVLTLSWWAGGLVSFTCHQNQSPPGLSHRSKSTWPVEVQEHRTVVDRGHNVIATPERREIHPVVNDINVNIVNQQSGLLLYGESTAIVCVSQPPSRIHSSRFPLTETTPTTIQNECFLPHLRLSPSHFLLLLLPLVQTNTTNTITATTATAALRRQLLPLKLAFSCTIPPPQTLRVPLTRARKTLALLLLLMFFSFGYFRFYHGHQRQQILV